MHRTSVWCIAVFLAGAAVGPARAQDDFRPHPFDWPQWQGPKRTALSRETGLLKSWPKDGPTQLWQCKNGGVGFVTPSVASGRILLMGNIGTTEYVICLSEKNGETLWRAVVGTVR